MEPKRNGSNFYMLTAQVLNDKNLNHAEKITMAILTGLADEDGKCYPSNEWLCEKLDISERPLRSILEKLEKNNYIKREIMSWANDPFKKYRIIFVNTDFKLFLPEAENSRSGKVENSRIEGLKTAGIIDKKELIIDKKERKESSLTRAKEKSAMPPHPLFESFYKDQFEGKIKISKEQRDKLIEKYGGMESLVDKFAEKLYRYSLQKPKKFNDYKRHDLVIEDWIDKDLAESNNSTKSQQSGFSGLSDAQSKNWKLNQELVSELKIDCPHKCNGLHFYYKHHVLKDKNNPHFDISGLIDHKDFCRYLEKCFGLSILKVRFPNE